MTKHPTQPHNEPLSTIRTPYQKHVGFLLGSNLSSPSKSPYDFILFGVTTLIQEIPLIDPIVSSLYETPPWGNPNQDNFLNAAVTGYTDWKPSSLLNLILHIEKEAGRIRTPLPSPHTTKQYLPRTLDIDIMFYSNEILDTDILTLPHPGLSDRLHVLIPMAEILPNTWKHPKTHKSIEELLCESTKDSAYQKKSHGLDPGIRKVAPPPQDIGIQ